jgi:hypothetical protein
MDGVMAAVPGRTTELGAELTAIDYRDLSGMNDAPAAEESLGQL